MTSLSQKTRAEQFRADQQLKRSRPKPKKPKAHKPDPAVNAGMAGVSGTGKARRNFGKRSDNTTRPALEVSTSIARPTRKSTRSSAGRLKQGTQLTRRQKGAVNSPKERAARANART